MRWYLPSWNGDIRAERDPDDPKQTLVTIVEPTVAELMTLGKLEHLLRKKGWYKEDEPLWEDVKDQRRTDAKRQQVLVHAKIDKVAKLLVDGFKPGKQTLTAFVYKDGEIETVDGTQGDEALEKAAAKAADGKGHRAATVKRPTPSCPACRAGAVEPATEVLLDFLDEGQHRDWARDRTIVVQGGLTSHRYLIAHRNSPTAAELGRIAFDLDDGRVMHFHDSSVPPEEEVLAAKLILEHREPWLRNEATCIGATWTPNGLQIPGVLSRRQALVFKNPFGDGGDGVEDAVLTATLGNMATIAGAALHVEGAGPVLTDVLVELIDTFADDVETAIYDESPILHGVANAFAIDIEEKKRAWREKSIEAKMLASTKWYEETFGAGV